MTTEAVKVSLADVKAGIPDALLHKAFGQDSLGIILISDLPSDYAALRTKVLKSASLLAKLDKAILDEMECPEGHWLVGWSLGKEKLTVKTKILENANDNEYKIVKKPDYLKGSYYINCSFFINDELEGPPQSEQDKFSKYKAYVTLNKWPNLQNVRSAVLEDFKVNAKKLCNFIIQISLLVAQSCDRFIQNEINDKLTDGDFKFSSNYLESVVKNSYTTKARLLHYYPKTHSQVKDDDNNNWCGEHLDHSCLTGLTSALYLDETSIAKKLFDEITAEDVDNLQELESSPDSEAGLYIKNRHGDVVKVAIPKDCLAFQTGSALQEISRNRFKAVPHYVKGCNVEGIARNTLAVFCQPNLGDKVNQTETFSEYADRILGANH